MNIGQATKPTAFMKQDVLDTLHHQDCFFAFVTSNKHAQVPLFTWEQVKKMLYGSNESYFDAQDFIDDVEAKLK